MRDRAQPDKTFPRTIDLRVGALESPLATDLDRVASVMIWPTDPAAQMAGVETSLVELMMHNRDHLSREGALWVADLARRSLPLAQVQDRAREGFINGVRAGLYLLGTIEGAASGNNLPVMKSLASQVSSAFPSSKISAKTFRSYIWPDYRQVSHFWAAWLVLTTGKVEALSDLEEKSAAVQLSAAFPCAVSEFSEFLRLADLYRQTGEVTRTKQSPVTVLSSGECWRVVHNSN